MRATFKLSKHAKKRIKQRQLPLPNDIHLVIAKNNAKSKISDRCKEKYKSGYIYWRGDMRKETVPVYVCSQMGVNKFVVITAFDIKKEMPKKIISPIIQFKGILSDGAYKLLAKLVYDYCCRLNMKEVYYDKKQNEGLIYNLMNSDYRYSYAEYKEIFKALT